MQLYHGPDLGLISQTWIIRCAFDFKWCTTDQDLYNRPELAIFKIRDTLVFGLRKNMFDINMIYIKIMDINNNLWILIIILTYFFMQLLVK